ncbi:hypothetical protein ACG98H_03410 [Corynebacterium sp. L4756]|uniref:hypothetical protein n=1 Tax=unclassified Corynebacterium TaxID=2624378 RepID=UPI00374DEE48
MMTGFLVNPDLTRRKIEFELEHANQFLGGATEDRVAVSFQDDGTLYAALFSAEAKADGAEPNPVASLARNHAGTGNSAFLQDPYRAICGSVIFVDAEGGEVTDEIIDGVENSVRAVKNYREDNEEEYILWRAAVLNSGRQEAEERDAAQEN